MMVSGRQPTRAPAEGFYRSMAKPLVPLVG